MKLKQSKLREVSNYLRDKAVLKAYLFGSYVRGEADETSDVDILVELDYSRSIGFEFIQIKFDLENILQKKVDLVSSGGLSEHAGPFINKEKVLIYAR